MPASAFSYLSLRRPPEGRAIFALGKMRLIASDEREPGLKPLIDGAIEQARETLRLERGWVAVKATRTTRRGDAAALDIGFDQAWMAFESAVKGQLFGPPADPVRQAAEKVLKKVLPAGASAITQQSFEQQLAASDSAIEALETDFRPQVELLNLGRHVSTLKAFAEDFRAELHKDARPEVTWDEVISARRRTQELYAGVVFHVLGRYADAEPASVARREELLAEVNRQDDLLKDLYRRHRPEVDIDPDSGEVVDEPVLDPAA